MANMGDLVIGVRGDTRALSTDMRRMERIVAQGAKRMKSALNLGRLFVGAKMAMGTIRGMIGIARATQDTIEEYANFDDTMRMVGQRSQALTGEMHILRGEAMRLGRTTSFTAVQVAEAMKSMATAGFKPAAIEGMTGSILTLARATGTDLAESAEVAAILMRQFGMETEDVSHLTDVMTFASNNSMMTVTKMKDAFSKFGPIAAETGVSLEEAAAGAMALANSGAEASTIGTGLRRILTTSAAKAEELKKVFGGQSFLTDEGKFVGIIKMFQIINKQTKDLTQGDRMRKLDEAYSLLGITAAATLSRNTDEVLANFDQMMDGIDGLAQKGADALDSGIGGGIRRVKSAWEGFKLTLVENMEGPLTELFEKVAKKINEITDKLPEWINMAKIWSLKMLEALKVIKENWPLVTKVIGNELELAFTRAWVMLRDAMSKFFFETLPGLFKITFTHLMKEIEAMKKGGPAAMMRGVGGIVQAVPGPAGIFGQALGIAGDAADPGAGGGQMGFAEKVANFLFADGVDIAKMQQAAQADRDKLTNEMSKRQNQVALKEWLEQQKNAAKKHAEVLLARGKQMADKLRDKFDKQQEEDEKKKKKGPMFAPGSTSGKFGGAGAQFGTAEGYRAILRGITSTHAKRMDSKRNDLLEDIKNNTQENNQNQPGVF
jgi:TP901 family phage tail tape measure protein